MRELFVVVYAGETEQDGTQCGNETKRRCQTALHFIEKHKDKKIVLILAAGIRPDEPDFPELKKVMEKYLEHQVDPAHVTILLAEKDGWGTIQETAAAAHLLKRIDVHEAYVVSSWYHLPRIFLIWKRLGGFKIHPVSSPSPRLYSILLEPLKLIKVLLN